PEAHAILPSASHNVIKPTHDYPAAVPSDQYLIAHYSGYNVKAGIGQCVWVYAIEMPTNKQGTVSCSLTNTTIDQKPGAVIPAENLVEEWTRDGEQDLQVIQLVKENGLWLVNNGDNSGVTTK